MTFDRQTLMRKPTQSHRYFFAVFKTQSLMSSFLSFIFPISFLQARAYVDNGV
jgi:hypothetical protein